MDERALPALSVDQSPATREREEWQAYWARHEQPWRTEPEIEVERQEELRAHLSILPDVERGVYPFSQVKLSRADVECLTGMEAVVLSITAFHGRVFSFPFQLGSPQGVVTAVEAITGLLFEGIFIAMLTRRFFGR